MLAGSMSAEARTALKLDEIRSQQTEIRQKVESPTGRYKDMDAQKRVELLAKQDFVLRTIEGKQSPDEIPEPEWIEVFNALEWIEATLNNAEDERMVCTRMKTTGSNRPQRVCKTAKQMRLDQEYARKKIIEERRNGS